MYRLAYPLNHRATRHKDGHRTHMITYRYKWITQRTLSWFLTGCLFFLGTIVTATTPAAAASDNHIVHVGALVKQGKEITSQRWTATTHYLTKKFPDKKFDLVPLHLEEINTSIASKAVDFILVDPALYVQLADAYDIVRIATLMSSSSHFNTASLGSVIISKADNFKLTSIQDIQDRSLAAVNPKSLGGWQIALARFAKEGLDTETDIMSLKYLGSHESVIQSVLNGSVDVGIVRTGTLESMENEGKISLHDFSVLPSAVPNSDFPLVSSTRLYPDWAFAVTSHVPASLAKEVAAALFQMKPDDTAALNADINGWTIPEDYAAVHQLLTELKLPPYQVNSTTKPYELIIKNSHLALIIALAFLGIIIMYVRQKLLTKELKHAQNSLRNYSNRLQLAAEAGELSIWEWNVKQNKFYCDERISQLFGIRNRTNIYTSQDWYSCVHPDDVERVQTAMHLALSGGKKFDVEYRIVRTDSEISAVRSASIYRFSRSRGGLVVNGVTWDISNHRRLLEENKKLAMLDPLTNAKNRRGFFPLANAEFTRCRRYGNKLALLMIDIDDFKQINDTHGHSAGDATLVSFARVCHTILRTSDFFCRLGGEEFIALLHESSMEQAFIVAERLRTEIEKTSVKSDTTLIKYTVSIGISILIEPDQTIEDTISRSDRALYLAKTSGKNCVVYE